MTREDMIARAISSLAERGFQYTSFLETNTCFDIIARCGTQTIVLKAYDNIDSIRREQAEEMAKLGQVLGASCIIIGKKTKVFGLEDNTVYLRYGIPAITITTFDGLLRGQVPSVKYFKGRHIVDIDFDALRRKRGELNLSLQELAEKVGVAGETLYRFEHGASTSAETAVKLEKELHEEFTKKIPVLGYMQERKKVDEVPEEKLLEKVHDLGLKMALFGHAPFSAFGEAEKGMFISTGKGKFDIPKKAVELRKTSAVIGSDSIIVTKEYKYKSVGGVPVIGQSDLETISRVKDLRKLMHEREEEK